MTDLSQRLANLSPQQRKLLQQRLQNRDTPPEAIAIVGMSCRFPGAPDLRAYWRLIQDGIDATSEIGPERWDVDALYDPTGEEAGKMSVRRAGLVSGIDQFDPQFFGISPREAARMDPQQRLLLEVCWEALENGGIAPDSVAGAAAGVFVGIGGTDYAKIPAQFENYYQHIDAHVGTGNALSIAANRISYIFDLHGPSLAVDTACSSSTMAIHLAVQSLRNRECSMALAGGVNAILTPETTIAFSKARMLSPDGRCRPFDAGANGYVRGEGCGVLALKRLSDAQKDGDHIFAVIRATATNQDGRTSGITAPNALSQQAVILAALSQAGLKPADVAYVEAHGTGTPLGDPIEIEALRNVFRKQSEQDQPCYVTSVKANVGHMETVSGVAGIIKVALMMRHGKIPAQLHLEHLNPRISLDGSRLAIPTSPLDWPIGPSPVTAGVSSFGFGGANTHIVLQSAAGSPAAAEKPADQPAIDRRRHVVTLSGKSAVALRQSTQRLSDALQEQPDLPVADVAATLNRGRAHFAHRTAIVTSSTQQLREQLSQVLSDQTPRGVFSGVVRAGAQPGVAFLFTGQGSQYVDMGRGLYETQPLFRQTLQQCDQILRDLLPQSLLSVLYPELHGAQGTTSSAAALIHETQYTQPALFAIEYALATLWRHWGIEPVAVIGHSVGEYVAACVAGMLSLEDALRLIAHRGRLMQRLPSGGQMVALFASAEQVGPLVRECGSEQLAIAAANGPENTVVSGDAAAMEALLQRCERLGISSQRLNVSHAFHSPLMQPMLDEFRALAAACTFHEPQIPLISNVTGGVQQGPWDAAYLCEHVLGTVRFADAVATLAAMKPDVLLEVGPAPVLIGMGRRCWTDWPAQWLPSLRSGQHDEEVLLQSVAQLEVAGAALNWYAFDQPWRRERLPLPTYPFERQRCWFEPSDAKPRSLADAAVKGSHLHELLGSSIPTPLPQQIFQRQLAASDPSYLAEHRVQDSTAFPAAGYIELSLAAAEQVFGAGVHRVEDLLIQSAMFFPEQDHRVVQTIVAAESGGSCPVEISSAKEPQQSRTSWTLHAYARISHGDQATDQLAAPQDYHSVASRVIDVQTGEQFYETMAARKLQYGLRFRVLGKLSRTQNEAWGEVQLDAAVQGELAAYHLHPALGDALFQTCGGLVPAEPDGSYSPFTYMPTHVRSVRVLREPAGRLWTYGRRHGESSAPSPEFVEGDVWLINEAGEVVAEFLSVRVTRVGQAAGSASAKAPEQLLYRLAWEPSPWQPLEERPAESAQQPPGQPWLIFADESGIGDALAARLSAAGASPIVVRHGDRFQTAAEHNGSTCRITIGPGAADYQQLFEFLSQPDRPPLAGAIHLWSLTDAADQSDAAAIQRGSELGAHSALRLIQHLLRHAGQRSDFAANWRGIWMATCGAQQTGQDAVIAPAQAPLWGLGRVAAVEHPELRSRLLDLDSHESLDDTVSALLAEINSDSDEDQVAYRCGRRLVARLQSDPQALQSGAPAMKTRSLPAGPCRLRFAQTGSFDSLYFEPFQPAGLRGSEVELQVAAAGLNFSDVLKAMGLYPGITDPVVPLGIECAGTVLAVGPDVKRFKPGDRVYGVAPFSFGSHARTAEYTLSPLPRGLDDAAAATIPIAFMTAYYALVQLADLQPGERVLIHAGAGGVGLAAIQIAQHRGAEVFATAGSEEKREFLRSLGVQHVFSSRSLEFAEQILQVTGREGVDVVLNSLPGEAITKSLSILRAYGRFLEIGKTDIYQNRLLGLAPFQDNLSYFAIDLDRILRQRPQVITRLLSSLDAHFAAGDFQPLVHTAFAAEDITDAFRYMAQRKNIGKVIVTMPQQSADQQASGGAAHDAQAAGTALITGGLGALGLALAEHLVDRGESHVVLLSRREPNEQQTAVIRRLRESAQVQVVSGDVADPRSLQGALQRIAADFPSLTSVYHAAGVLDDGLLFDLSDQQWQRPLAPKVQGTWNLHQATIDQPIKRFVLFSSIAALLGSPGQGNYAAGNAFLDAFAAYRRANGLPATSINWGPWADAGMAAGGDIAEQLQKRGLGMIPTAQGMQLLEQLVDSGTVNLAVMDVDWSKMLRGGSPSPYLAAFAQQDTDAEQASEQRVDQAFIERLQAAKPEQRDSLLQHYFIDELARIMGWQADQIDPQQPLSELGMDSLMAMELKNNLERQLAITIPMAAFLESPSISSLSRHAAVNFGGASAGEAGEETAAAYQVLLPLKATGSKSPWFCIHPLGGNAGCYADLAKYAPEDQSVIGVWGRGADGVSAPPESLQEMIDQYIAAITDYHEGPYHLLGWSAGGIYAYEIARRLREQGHEVALLALLDTPLPSIYDNIDLSDDARFLYDFTQFSNVFLRSGMQVSYEQLRGLSHDDALSVILNEAKREGLVAKNIQAQYIERLVETSRAHVRMIKEYRLEDFGQEIHLYRPEVTGALEAISRQSWGDDLGWSEQLGSHVITHQTPGDHFSMLLGDAAAELGQKLAQAGHAAAPGDPVFR